MTSDVKWPRRAVSTPYGTVYEQARSKGCWTVIKQGSHIDSSPVGTVESHECGAHLLSMGDWTEIFDHHFPQQPAPDVAELRERLAGAEGERDEALRKLKIESKKSSHSLANNLCPDHRDKQLDKPCLACGIEHLEHRLTCDCCCGAKTEKCICLDIYADEHGTILGQRTGFRRLLRKKDEELTALRAELARAKEALQAVDLNTIDGASTICKSILLRGVDGGWLHKSDPNIAKFNEWKALRDAVLSASVGGEAQHEKEDKEHKH